MPYPAMPLTGWAGNDDGDDVGGDGDFGNDDGKSISISEDHGHEVNDGLLIL